MMTVEGVLTYLGVNKSAALSGLVGGLMSLRWVPECNWFYRTNTILSAGIMANFFTPPIYQYFKIAGMGEGAVGFIIGLFSITILAAAFKILQESQLHQIAVNFIRQFTGGAKP
jgi:hypothetical protein